MGARSCTEKSGTGESAARNRPPGGADAFYKGHIAQDIEAKVKSHPANPGGLSAADIAGYQAKVREPICTDYKKWTVCGMPPPSSLSLDHNSASARWLSW
jgi:gamma-glutamyltranspeptidase